jgi:hypothetical protein
VAGFKRRLQTQLDRQLKPSVLAELVEGGVDVFCWCNRCGHHATLSAHGLLTQLGPQYPVPEIGARLCCGSCGSKDIATRPNWPSLGQVARHD